MPEGPKGRCSFQVSNCKYFNEGDYYYYYYCHYYYYYYY